MHSKPETQQQYLVDMLQKAFDSGYIKQDHFFFKLMLNTVENLVNKKTVNNYRYSEEIIHWCLLLRFIGGTKLWTVLRGKKGPKDSSDTLDHFNLVLPSISTLKRYLPELSFGRLSVSNISKIHEACQKDNICNQVCISYDEMEIRSGLVYHSKLGQVIGFIGDNTRSAAKVYSQKDEDLDINDIASKICQFFCTTLDGRFTFPVCYAGHEDDHKNFIKTQMKRIKEAFGKAEKNSYQFQIVCSSSYGFSGNYQFAKDQTLSQDYCHIFDFVHVVKHWRNLLFNRKIELDGVSFCIETLVRLRSNKSVGKFITEDVFAPVDKMKVEPVVKIMTPDMWKLLLHDKDAEVQALGKYLKFMHDFYHVFRDEGSKEEKINIARRLLTFLKAWKTKTEVEVY